MQNELLRSLILLGPAAGSVLYIFLRIFFKGSILFKVGAIVGLFAMFLAMTSSLTSRLGAIHYIWAIPMATLMLTIAFRYLRKILQIPLINIKHIFNFLAHGDIQSATKIQIHTGDEFGHISESANNLVNSFSDMATFAQEIGKGNLKAEFEALSEKDTLGNALLEMQKSLKIAQEEDEKRKIEDEKHFWTNEGFAKFGEILRNNTDDNTEFYYSIVSSLVKYVGASQGGLFLINEDNEDDKHIELVSMYAFERRKYAQRRIEYGDTLVGQCILEGESIYMTEVPQNYIRITSGLGDANPACLLLVPLKFNEKVYGVIELAAFEEFEDYKKNFIEKLGESIASTISTYKVNLQTKQLLEDSKIKSEEMAAQEEEIRQNMEELQTTQEESARRESEMSNLLNTLHNSMLIAELDLSGTVLSINTNYAQLLDSTPQAIQGRQWASFLTSAEFLDECLDKVRNDEVHRHLTQLTNGKSASESYALVNDENGFPLKILITALPA